MIVRHIVRFRSTLPKDIIETEDGSGFVQPPGKSVADALEEIFRTLGFDVDGPDPESDFVWEMGVSKGSRNFGAWLNLVDDYYLTFKNPSSIDRLLGRIPEAYVDLLRGCSRELGADPRFSDVRWFTHRELDGDAPGEAEPVA
ncbi:hypothetical protein [Phenylobacterium sp.]|uniref:hypothetical protein n=1 Tax=Phenylobacterium sp. TaxID=1871053 RepID=UPI00301E0F4F